MSTRLLRGFLLALAVSIVTIFCPTPYRVEAPGRAVHLHQIIQVEKDAPTYSAQGHFLLPTVVSEPATLLYCVYALITPEAHLTRDGDEQPQAQSPRRGEFQMEVSQLVSTVVAFRELGYDLSQELRGIRILSVDPGSPNSELLQPTDLIVEVAGERPRSVFALRKKLASKSPGDHIELTIERAGELLLLEAEVYRPRKAPILGIKIRPEHDPIELPFSVTFDSGNTSGASGGLVFALELFNRFTEEDITKGRTIAATGTLDLGGQVGPIEGLDLKLQGAKLAGAQIALVPRSNFQQLREVPKGLKVIPVDSFNEALDALQD